MFTAVTKHINEVCLLPNSFVNLIFIREENIWSMEEKRKREGKGGKYLEKENIWSGEDKMNREGKGGEYL